MYITGYAIIFTIIIIIDNVPIQQCIRGFIREFIISSKPDLVIALATLLLIEVY